tara:strand:- start:18 stop:176 length:159 start_codon:yes stop_codon:yes gene_type:complete
MGNSIIGILDVLRSSNFYGAGKCIEIAKGQNEYITTFKELKRKAIRVWQLRK